MGYTTDFDGGFELSPNATDEFVEYINNFSTVRHMPRDIEVLKEADPDWASHCFHTDLGRLGEYYLGPDETSVTDHNCGAFGSGDPKVFTPGLWCQWRIEKDPRSKRYYLCWDGGEKFYAYIEWLQYLIDHFFSREGILLNGTVKWAGEEPEDLGIIEVRDNIIDARRARIIY